MSSFFLTSLIAVTSLCILPGGLGQTLDQDFSCYEKGGVIDINPMEGKKALEGVARLRGFLWRHWIERKRGMIVAVLHGVDSPTGHVSYFVKPDDQGVWQIVIESPRRSPSNSSDVVERFVAYDVKRVEIVNDGYSERVEIPKNANRRPASYHLRLTDRRGQFLEEF